jgi:hypothetical protein
LFTHGKNVTDVEGQGPEMPLKATRLTGCL